MQALTNPKLVSFHENYKPIVYFMGTFLKDLEPNQVDNKTYVIDKITSDQKDVVKYVVKNIFNAPTCLISSCSPIPPWISPTQDSGDIIISFVIFIDAHNNFVLGCYLQCSEADRQMIVACKRNHICLHLWVDSSCHSYWSPKESKYSKTFDNLYIEETKITHVREIVTRFTQKNEFYQKQGIPYKVSFLLQGRPGTGKTSFIKALSKETGYDVCIMNLNHIVRIEEMIQGLDEIRNNSRHTTLILAFEDLHKIPKELYPQIFNVLDGVYDVNDCLIVMTSNLPYQQLDPTLSRCGRVNYIIEFDFMTLEMKKKMFMNLVPQFADVLDEFMKKIQDTQMVPAILEAYLLQYTYEASHEAMINNINCLIKTAEEDNKVKLFSGNDLGANLMVIR